MGNISYRPLIEDMTWSYSRLNSFNSCPEAWFLKYIKGQPEEEMFYSSFGKLIHEILEGYYKGKIKQSDMLMEFLTRFSSDVSGEQPDIKIVDKYIDGAASYLSDFQPLPYEMLDVEKFVRFKIGEKNFVGVIDYIGSDNGKLCIVDNKSGDIRPRSKRKYPTQKDMELDEKLRQLYLYSTAIMDEFGRFPDKLCFNCFRTGVLVEEPFVLDRYNDTVEWALEEIDKIENEEVFIADPEFFKCKWICGFNSSCAEYEEYLDDRRHGRR